MFLFGKNIQKFHAFLVNKDDTQNCFWIYRLVVELIMKMA